jgi:N-dimethylarginine dimethylaminohydrolase
MARILMCRPDYYGIEYEINPWMSRSRGAVRERAQQQWQTLYETLLRLQVTVELLDPQPGLPDLVFTANAGLVFRDTVILSHFRYPQRQREEPVFENWFRQHGFKIALLAPNLFFEGAGDALFCGRTLFAGYRIRSDCLAHQEVARLIQREVLPLELVNPHFYHLDTCFCPLTPDQAIYYPPAFDSYAQRVLHERIPHLIACPERDAYRFGCNAVVVGKYVVLNAGCDALAEMLQHHGFEPILIPLDEFLKAGGSAKCLTLRLDGEDAAIWND